MISIYSYYNGSKKPCDVRCKSTDVKPIGVPNGSTCIEIDTGKGFLYDEVGEEWNEIPQGSSVVINPASGVSF